MAYDALERLQDLSFEISDIGDEVATYIDNLAQAIADWDADLVVDCLEEFDVIVTEARDDVRGAAAEMRGVHKALTSGLRSGTLSAGDGPRARSGRGAVGHVPEPLPLTSITLTRSFPAPTLSDASKVGSVLQKRTAAVVAQCEALAEWVADATAAAVDDISSVSLPLVFGRAEFLIHDAVSAWQFTVADTYPPYTRMMRGCQPPPFLAERARVDHIIDRVNTKRRLRASGHYAC